MAKRHIPVVSDRIQPEVAQICNAMYDDITEYTEHKWVTRAIYNVEKEFNRVHFAIGSIGKQPYTKGWSQMQCRLYHLLEADYRRQDK